MRRQDIQLLAHARRGDAAALCEAARRYLGAVDGFPRHPEVAIEYLRHPSVFRSAAACIILAEGLALDDIVRMRQFDALNIAAKSGSVAALVKLAAWKLATHADREGALVCLRAAAAGGHRVAGSALEMIADEGVDGTRDALLMLDQLGDIRARVVIRLAAADALAAHAEPAILGQVIRCLLELVDAADPMVSKCVCDGLERSSDAQPWWQEVATERLEHCLEAQVAHGNARAALILGRALCGLDHRQLRATALVSNPNMRRGAAYLLRAADSGCDEAWLLLYRVHANYHLSVANPQFARFFLEKAALKGQVEAQRRLGALILRAADTVQEMELGIHWLHEAALQKDERAVRLLHSLVLPVAGDDRLAESAIESVRGEDPWLASRLRVARDFGLTKLEALSVDLVAGLRPWGLWVGPNPFITQSRRSAARAVPALSVTAAQNLRRAATLFEQSRRDNLAVEGDFRKRASRLRRVLERHGFDESLFFADASSSSVDAMRYGRKWAARAKAPLQMALAS